MWTLYDKSHSAGCPNLRTLGNTFASTTPSRRRIQQQQRGESSTIDRAETPEEAKPRQTPARTNLFVLVVGSSVPVNQPPQGTARPRHLLTPVHHLLHRVPCTALRHTRFKRARPCCLPCPVSIHRCTYQRSSLPAKQSIHEATDHPRRQTQRENGMASLVAHRMICLLPHEPVESLRTPQAIRVKHKPITHHASSKKQRWATAHGTHGAPSTHQQRDRTISARTPTSHPRGQNLSRGPIASDPYLIPRLVEVIDLPKIGTTQVRCLTSPQVVPGNISETK